MRPEVMAPAVMLPVLSEVEKRLVELAVVAKKLVVVALTPVRFWREVLPPTVRDPAIAEAPVISSTPAVVVDFPIPSPPVK